MTDVTMSLEDLQKTVRDAVSQDLEAVTLMPQSSGGDESSRPTPISDQASIMTDWQVVPSDKYKWSYVSARYLWLSYSLDVGGRKFEVGQFQIMSDVDKDEYSASYVPTLPNLTITQTTQSVGSPGVSLGIIHDPTDPNVLHFSPSAINVSTNYISINKHGLKNGDVVFYSNYGPNGAAPIVTNGALVAYNSYLVRGVTTGSFQLTGTDGLAMDFTSQGSGIHHLSRWTPTGTVKSPKERKFGLAFLVTAVDPSVSFLPGAISGSTITVNNHGMAAGTKVSIRTTGVLPNGILEKTKYFIVNSATNTFQLSESKGGTAVALGSQGSGIHTAYQSPWPILKASIVKAIPT